MTNWDRYFGDARKSAESVSRLVDFLEQRHRGVSGEGISPFTNNFLSGGDCEYGLIHQDTLWGWLEKEAM